MSKLCKNCGSEMQDQEVVCASCGTENEVAAKPAAKPQKTKLIGLAACALVLIVLLVALFGGGYKKAFNNYVAVNYKGKANKIDDLAPKQYWKWLEEEKDFDLKEYKEEYKENWEDRQEALEKTYGKNIKVKLDVEDKETWKKDDVKAVAKALNEQYDIREGSVKKIIEIEGTMTIKGSEDEKEEDIEGLTFIKIGSKWYPVTILEVNDEYAVVFTVGPMQ